MGPRCKLIIDGWWTIGIVVLDGILIAGAVVLLNTNLSPNITTKIADLFAQVPVIGG